MGDEQLTFSNFDTLIVERHGPVGWLINIRPDQLIAMSSHMRDVFGDAWLELDAAAGEVVTTLAKSATVGLGLAKWLLHVGATTPLDEHLRNEAFARELSSRSEDFREGLKAFGEKRTPEFGGR
jgi:enoyl-CoA hydratase/carnithine racemase